MKHKILAPVVAVSLFNIASATAEGPSVDAILDRLRPTGVVAVFKNGYEGEDELGNICKLNIDLKYKAHDGRTGKVMTMIDSGPEGKVVEVEILPDSKIYDVENEPDHAYFRLANPVKNPNPGHQGEVNYWYYTLDVSFENGRPSGYRVIEEYPGHFTLDKSCSKLKGNREKNNNRPKSGVWG